MTAHRNVLAFVMAGGEGSRLHPLTANRCKPAVPFNAGTRRGTAQRSIASTGKRRLEVAA